MMSALIAAEMTTAEGVTRPLGDDGLREDVVLITVKKDSQE